MQKVGLAVVVFCAAVIVLLLLSSPGVGVQQHLKKGDMAVICLPDADMNIVTATTDPGNCRNGSEKERLSVLKIADDVAVLCSCGHGCSCDMHRSNPYKCSCNAPVRVVKLMK